MNPLNPTLLDTRARRVMQLLLGVALLLLPSIMVAQPAMTRTTFTGTYTPISGTASSTGDDVFAGGIPIGFTFNYLGTNYTTVGQNTNGWISFTATASNAGNVALYTTAAPNATLAPWWDDLNSSSVQYLTTGSPGSQVFTIQWVSLSYFTGSTRTLNYQVKLYEGTNVIEFWYGAAPSGTLSASESASIGIENQTGGPVNYIDGVTGSSRVGNGSLQSDRWPNYNIRFTPGAPTALAAGTYNVGIG